MNDDCMVPVHEESFKILAITLGEVCVLGGGGGLVDVEVGGRVQILFFSFFLFKTSNSKYTELKLDCLMLI